VEAVHDRPTNVVMFHRYFLIYHSSVELMLWNVLIFGLRLSGSSQKHRLRDDRDLTIEKEGFQKLVMLE